MAAGPDRVREELVTFSDVSFLYPTGSDITVRYSLHPDLCPGPLDWIGIFPHTKATDATHPATGSPGGQGSDPPNPLAFVWAPMVPKHKKRPAQWSVTFPAKVLQALPSATASYCLSYVQSPRAVLGRSDAFMVRDHSLSQEDAGSGQREVDGSDSSTSWEDWAAPEGCSSTDLSDIVVLSMSPSRTAQGGQRREGRDEQVSVGGSSSEGFVVTDAVGADMTETVPEGTLPDRIVHAHSPPQATSQTTQAKGTKGQDKTSQPQQEEKVALSLESRVDYVASPNCEPCDVEVVDECGRDSCVATQEAKTAGKKPKKSKRRVSTPPLALEIEEEKNEPVIEKESAGTPLVSQEEQLVLFKDTPLVSKAELKKDRKYQRKLARREREKQKEKPSGLEHESYKTGACTGAGKEVGKVSLVKENTDLKETDLKIVANDSFEELEAVLPKEATLSKKQKRLIKKKQKIENSEAKPPVGTEGGVERSSSGVERSSARADHHDPVQSPDTPKKSQVTFSPDEPNIFSLVSPGTGRNHLSLDKFGLQKRKELMRKQKKKSKAKQRTLIKNAANAVHDWSLFFDISGKDMDRPATEPSGPEETSREEDIGCDTASAGGAPLVLFEGLNSGLVEPQVVESVGRLSKTLAKRRDASFFKAKYKIKSRHDRLGLKGRPASVVERGCDQAPSPALQWPTLSCLPHRSKAPVPESALSYAHVVKQTALDVKPWTELAPTDIEPPCEETEHDARLKDPDQCSILIREVSSETLQPLENPQEELSQAKPHQCPDVPEPKPLGAVFNAVDVACPEPTLLDCRYRLLPTGEEGTGFSSLGGTGLSSLGASEDHQEESTVTVELGHAIVEPVQAEVESVQAIVESVQAEVESVQAEVEPVQAEVEPVHAKVESVEPGRGEMEPNHAEAESSLSQRLEREHSTVLELALASTVLHNKDLMEQVSRLQRKVDTLTAALAGNSTVEGLLADTAPRRREGTNDVSMCDVSWRPLLTQFGSHVTSGARVVADLERQLKAARETIEEEQRKTLKAKLKRRVMKKKLKDMVNSAKQQQTGSPAYSQCTGTRVSNSSDDSEAGSSGFSCCEEAQTGAPTRPKERRTGWQDATPHALVHPLTWRSTVGEARQTSGQVIRTVDISLATGQGTPALDTRQTNDKVTPGAEAGQTSGQTPCLTSSLSQSTPAARGESESGAQSPREVFFFTGASSQVTTLEAGTPHPHQRHPGTDQSKPPKPGLLPRPPHPPTPYSHDSRRGRSKTPQRGQRRTSKSPRAGRGRRAFGQPSFPQAHTFQPNIAGPSRQGGWNPSTAPVQTLHSTAEHDHPGVHFISTHSNPLTQQLNVHNPHWQTVADSDTVARESVQSTSSSYLHQPYHVTDISAVSTTSPMVQPFPSWPPLDAAQFYHPSQDRHPNDYQPYEHKAYEHQLYEHKAYEYQPFAHKAYEHQPLEHKAYEHQPFEHKAYEHQLYEHKAYEHFPYEDHLPTKASHVYPTLRHAWSSLTKDDTTRSPDSTPPTLADRTPKGCPDENNNKQKEAANLLTPETAAMALKGNNIVFSLGLGSHVCKAKKLNISFFRPEKLDLEVKRLCEQNNGKTCGPSKSEQPLKLFG